MPYDPESYVHRIGRTGRAGREGRALLLVTPRERRMLQVIERVTGQKVAEVPAGRSGRVSMRASRN
jgi:ATP-dependent RNA helicase DeaD